MIKKVIKRIFNSLKRLFVYRPYFKLVSIAERNHEVFCEFEDFLSIDGNLIKINIKEVASNENIQKCISPAVLFLIGTIYSGYQAKFSLFKVRTINLATNVVTLENGEEKIIIGLNELLNDELLLGRINQLDLMKILHPYIYRSGYDTHRYLTEELPLIPKEKNSNIINLNIINS